VNVGDSRAVLSYGRGSKVIPLSRDHKPSDEPEKNRIVKASGQIYQTATIATGVDEKGNQCPPEIIIGPVRVFPGRLSVCRTFGDVEAKNPDTGGNPNVVIASPEIKSFKLDDHHDFVILGCDGIFDKLTDSDCVECVWNTVRAVEKPNVHDSLGLGVECIMKNSLNRRSLDNVTVVIIAFTGYKRAIDHLN
jgi:protein phosphatase 2C family protein 2/3